MCASTPLFSLRSLPLRRNSRCNPLPTHPYVLRLSFYPVVFLFSLFVRLVPRAIFLLCFSQSPPSTLRVYRGKTSTIKLTTLSEHGPTLDTKDEEEKRVTAASWPSVGSGVDRRVNACTGQETHSWSAWGCAEAAGMVLRCLSMTLRRLPPLVIVTRRAFSGCLVGVGVTWKGNDRRYEEKTFS